MKQKKIMIVGISVTIMILSVMGFFWDRHKKVQALVLYYYPNTETVKRSFTMTTPIETLNWEFKKIPFNEKYPDINKKLLEDKIKKDFDLEEYHYQLGDSIYYFNTPKSYWESLIGREGSVLLRRHTILSVRTASLN